MSATIRVGGVNAAAAGEWLPVVGGPCSGQLVRSVKGAPREAVLFRPGERLTSRGHDYWWNGTAYVPDAWRTP